MGNGFFEFVKYHALGNDYLFLDSSKFPLPSSSGIQKICHRNFGIGSDGILYGGRDANGQFLVQIINPDGSEAEISGNGLRIFSYAMFELGYVNANCEFSVKTFKKSAKCKIASNNLVEVDMGLPNFEDSNLPQPSSDGHFIEIGRRRYNYFPVSMGNPHCVVFTPSLSSQEAKTVGPALETNPAYPEQTNVQFAKILNSSNIAIEIWERGAGYTLASGSSACAVCAVANKLGLCGNAIAVDMPGGRLSVKIGQSGNIAQAGPVEKIAICQVANDFFTAPLPPQSVGVAAATQQK